MPTGYHKGFLNCDPFSTLHFSLHPHDCNSQRHRLGHINPWTRGRNPTCAVSCTPCELLCWSGQGSGGRLLWEAGSPCPHPFSGDRCCGVTCRTEAPGLSQSLPAGGSRPHQEQQDRADQREPHRETRPGGQQGSRVQSSEPVSLIFPEEFLRLQGLCSEGQIHTVTQNIERSPDPLSSSSEKFQSLSLHLRSQIADSSLLGTSQAP